ncbi:DUF1674 domain-containing protein [Oricola indica]|jgi:hypothetical protein|uniref:DUF1674 domain-containing protein n=1 Tax=Oricola indica TaxID=2872591 RepID=UPI001CC03F68|nr:DUF1674 domain-containing protein [Oricola indica]
MSDDMDKDGADETAVGETGSESAPAKTPDMLPPAARRALAEAEARRAEMAAAEEKRRREIGGRGGKDPARYGDWEVKGIAVDF